MKKLLLCAAASLPVVLAAQPAVAKPGDKIANAYICVFDKNMVSRGQAMAESKRAAQAAGAQLTRTYSVALRGFAANMSAQAAANMAANHPSVKYCEQDQEVGFALAPGGKGKPGGGGGVQPAQETPWGIAAVNGGVPGNYATAWVLDSGIDLTHPDLNVDLTRSKSFVRDSSPRDQNGHGTHVAGTIAAYDNDIGVIGVAPGAPVVSVRVLDRRGSGSMSGVIAGVDYVAQYGQPGDVANMSLGGGVSPSLDQAVINAAAGGVRFALAAGNESDHADNHSPARANGPNLFTISAFSQGGNFASFSNYGNPPVDFAEPGVAIKSTWLDGGYNTISGTSMATPHFAGLLLLGNVRVGGQVAGDPDGNPDPIGVH